MSYSCVEFYFKKSREEQIIKKQTKPIFGKSKEIERKTKKIVHETHSQMWERINTYMFEYNSEILNVESIFECEITSRIANDNVIGYRVFCKQKIYPIKKPD